MRLDSRHWRRWRRWRRWPHRRRRRRPRWCREKRRPRKLGAAVDAISAQQAVAVLATIRADSVRVEVADLKREADKNQIAGARPHWKNRVFEFRRAPLRWGARNSASRQRREHGDGLDLRRTTTPNLHERSKIQSRARRYFRNSLPAVLFDAPSSRFVFSASPAERVFCVLA